MDESISFGSHHIDENETKESLSITAKELSLELYKLDLNSPQQVGKIDFDKIIRLYEIIRFSRGKFPFLMVLTYNTKKVLKKIGFYEDPHFMSIDGMPKALTGNILKLPDLIEINKKPLTIKTNILSILNDKNNLSKQVCIGGTDDAKMIVIGRPNLRFFKKSKKV